MITLHPNEIIVDNFAGGGGASTGIEAALGRSIDIAINHDAEAVAMHATNHPATVHLCQSVWAVNPRDVVNGRPVGLAWFSPDCKHFSKAKGGKPVEKRIRDLAWVVVMWARTVKPRVIMLENVEEFRDWGPLVTTDDGKQMPCPVRKGLTFRRWVRELRRCGYAVEHREMRACDYGAPTIRKRLFVIARRDGEPIVWPEPTHGDPNSEVVKSGRLKPWRTAAECIDWSLPCPSIFTRKKPLAEATLKRIARGVMRYVVNAKRPFIVNLTHAGGDRTESVDEPFKTVTGAHRGEKAVIVPTIIGAGGPAYSGKPVAVDKPFGSQTAENHRALVAAHITKFRTGATGSGADEPLATVTANSFIKRAGGAAPLGLVGATLVQTGYGERNGQAPRALDPEKPLGTVVAGGSKVAAVAAFLAQHNTGMVGHAPIEPVSTIVQKGCTQALVGAHLLNLKGSDRRARPIDDPAPSQQASGTHAALVAAFLDKYYGTGVAAPIDEPAPSATSRDRMSLVTVEIDGEPWVVVDIGMRMLTPRELFNAQGFPQPYIIDPAYNGKPMTKTAQIRMCGNSVCPSLSEALVRANFNTQASAEGTAA